MTAITVDLKNTGGEIKRINAVNNGPVAKSPNPNSWGNSSNMKEYSAAGIPFARNHDASFYARYGLEHSVDIHAVFPDFNADPCDPASYDFTCTDNYIKVYAPHRPEYINKIALVKLIEMNDDCSVNCEVVSAPDEF